MTTTPATQALLPVTQSDRDAAATIHVKNGCNPLLAGDDLMDDDLIVQAFAAHRIASAALSYDERVEYEGQILAAERRSIQLARRNNRLACENGKLRQAHSLPGDVGTEAVAWLRAISSWLLANDHDMKLPSGVLDTDPLDIADRLAALTPSALSGDAGEGE